VGSSDLAWGEGGEEAAAGLVVGLEFEEPGYYAARIVEVAFERVSAAEIVECGSVCGIEGDGALQVFESLSPAALVQKDAADHPVSEGRLLLVIGCIEVDQSLVGTPLVHQNVPRGQIRLGRERQLLHHGEGCLQREMEVPLLLVVPAQRVVGVGPTDLAVEEVECDSGNGVA